MIALFQVFEIFGKVILMLSCIFAKKYMKSMIILET